MITERENKRTSDGAVESRTSYGIKPMNNFHISCLKFLYLFCSLLSDSKATRVFYSFYTTSNRCPTIILCYNVFISIDYSYKLHYNIYMNISEIPIKVLRVSKVIKNEKNEYLELSHNYRYDIVVIQDFISYDLN